MNPTVRYLIVCEDIQTDPIYPLRVSLLGLLNSIRSIDEPAFPLLYAELCVFVQLTECRGVGTGRIDIVHADTNTVVFRTKTHSLPLSNDPLDVRGLSFRIRNCLFSSAGLYWIQFWYNNETIAQQPLLLRAST